MQFQTPTAWDSARYDAYTFYLAMSHLRTARPRALYLAFDETDDWAHDRRYDRVLDALSRTDGYLKELWTWLQSQPEYQRTHILITTDHGRGRTEQGLEHSRREDRRGAGDLDGVHQPGDGPSAANGATIAPLHTNQAAATVASWMGVDWTAGPAGCGAGCQVNVTREKGAREPTSPCVSLIPCPLSLDTRSIASAPATPICHSM